MPRKWIKVHPAYPTRDKVSFTYFTGSKFIRYEYPRYIPGYESYPMILVQKTECLQKLTPSKLFALSIMFMTVSASDPFGSSIFSSQRCPNRIR